MEDKKTCLSVSEMLSRSFNLSKNSIIEILKVFGIFIVPATVVFIGTLVGTMFSSIMEMAYSFSYSYSYFHAYDIFPFIGIRTILAIFLIVIIMSIVTVYANAIIIKILDDANKGKEVSWKSANSYAWQKKWSIIGLSILVALMILAAWIILILITVLLSILTIGIGLIILIPLLIAIGVATAPIGALFSSMLIVRDLTVTEAIGETFKLFKKGYFWITIGKLSAISGITIGLVIVLAMLQFIPFLGFIIAIIGQFIIEAYKTAYLNILVWDRTEVIETYEVDPII